MLKKSIFGNGYPFQRFHLQIVIFGVEFFDKYHALCVNHFIQRVELGGHIAVNIDFRINHKAQEIAICQYLAQKQGVIFSVLQYFNCIITDAQAVSGQRGKPPCFGQP